MGTRGPSRGVSGARRGLRHEGAVQEGERGERNKREGKGTKERERVVGKAAGGRVCIYTLRRAGLVRSDAIPDAAGGEGGHGPLNRMPLFTGKNLPHYFISHPWPNVTSSQNAD